VTQEQERRQEAAVNINRVIKDAKVNMTFDKFLDTYAENRGIKADPINVWRNMEKWQFDLPGNYKYLYELLGDKLNFLKESPKYYSEAQKRATLKWKKENIRRIELNFNKETDSDILEVLDAQENKQGFVKELIRQWMTDSKSISTK